MKQTHSLSLASFAFAAAALSLSPLHAQTVPSSVASVSVLPGWRMPSGTHMAALKISLAPGWHTYWRAPGAIGIPPQFDWSGSSQMSNLEFHWPTPTAFEQNGATFLGFEDELILPFEVTPARAGDIELRGEINMGVCEDVCLPLSAQFSGRLDANQAEPTPEIQAALHNQPRKLSGVKCAATPLSDGMHIKTSLTLKPRGGTEVAVLEYADKTVWVSEPITHRDGSTLSLESDLVPAHAAPFFVDRSHLTVTVVGDGVAYEAQGCTGD